MTAEEIVEQKRTEAHLNYEQLAERMRVSGAYLSRIRKGDRKAGVKFRMGAVVAFPELRYEYPDIFLR